MSIIKTTFISSTPADNSIEVLTWLQNNATAYFDTIEADENGNISCKIGETAELLLGFDSTTRTKFTIANGNSFEAINISTVFTTAIRTTKGLYLTNAGGSGSALNIFISKSDVGTTCFVVRALNLSYDRAFPSADFVHSTDIYTPIIYTQEADNTSLTHAVFKGGFYAPDLYFSIFSQFSDVAYTFSIDSKKYVTDGIIVLAE